MPRPLIAVSVLAAGTVVSLAACGSPGSTGTHHLAASASALATSSQAQAAKAAVKKSLAGCQAAGTTVTQWEAQLILDKRADQKLENCLGVKTPAERKALKTCVLGVARTELAKSGPLAPREAAFLTRAQSECVK